MIKYSNIFKSYTTYEGEPFYSLNRTVIFPNDDTLEIYDKYYIQDNTPWTILSYQLYGTIDYWWVLCALNKGQVFYAEEGKEILIIKKDYIEEVTSKIN